MMTVAMLRELLEDLDDNAEVRIATQPQWPMEYTIDAERAVLPVEEGDIVYIAVGVQLGYLPSDMADALGWR